MKRKKTIDFDQGWDYMQKGITKVKRILERLPEAPFSSEEYMMLYTYPFHLDSVFVPDNVLVLYFIFFLILSFGYGVFFLEITITEPFIICARRSRLTFHNSSTTITRTHLMNILKPL